MSLINDQWLGHDPSLVMTIESLVMNIESLVMSVESWFITSQQAKKLDVLARTCYRIMLGLNQSETHMTNVQLCKEAGTRPIS